MESTQDTQIEYHIEQILSIIGEDPKRDGLIETPKRVAKMLKTLFNGYTQNPEIHLKTFEVDTDELIVIKDIAFNSFCEHHMVPFIGKIHIGYIPNNKVIGLSKLIRIARIYSARLQVQERLTNQIADTIQEHLDPKGVMVWIEAEHLCMTIRGVKSPGSKTITSRATGVFLDNKDISRLEFLEAIK